MAECSRVGLGPPSGSTSTEALQLFTQVLDFRFRGFSGGTLGFSGSTLGFCFCQQDVPGGTVTEDQIARIQRELQIEFV